MKLLLSLLLTYSSVTYAEVKWDIPVEKFGEYTDKIYLMELTVGDTAKIDEYAIFCTNQDGNLALSGTTELGTGKIQLKMLPGKKVSLKVPDANSFLNDLISSEAYAQCQWWTAHKGKYVYTIESINNKKSISSLYKKP